MVSRMKLKRDWKKILVSAWSLRLWGIAVVLQGLEAAAPYFEYLSFIPKGFLATLSFLTAIGGGLARLIQQKGLEDGDESK